MLAPSPRRRYPGHHFVSFRRDMLGFLLRLAREHGDVVRWKMGPQEMVLLNHPDAIKDVLVTDAKNFRKGRGIERMKRFLGDGLLTSEEAFHLRQRRLAQPAFHRDRIAAYGAVMASHAERATSGWRDGETIDVADAMMRLTLGIVATTLFGADVRGEEAEIGDAISEMMRLFMFSTIPFSELVDDVAWLPTNRRFREVRQRLDAVVYRMIEQRRRSGTDGGDLLSMLLLAQDTEGDHGRMTDVQLRDEAMTIFLAGHETTANALTWTWYLLSRHPEAEARLHAEVDALGGRPPESADLASLPYTRMVLAESMRLYPPAWVIGRRAVGAFRVGEFDIPANAIVLLSQYVTHHDARWFPDPERFDPERWTAGAQASRPKFSYYPFGAGTRQCIGEGFAWMEGVLVLAAIAQRWRLMLVPDHPVALQPRITLRPKFGMKMRCEARTRAPRST
ncbi:MAG: cytochrome P450 [Gemmatimonadaceae bacterium]